MAGARDTDTLGTLDSEGAARAQIGAPSLACLTIVYHPDPARVGERALVLRQESGRAVLLSRNELDFAHPDGQRRPAPLADARLSRTPIALSASSGRVSIEAPARARMKLAGVPCDGRVIVERERLERGVLIELAKRVILLLHQAEIGPRPDDHGLAGESAGIRAVCRAIGRVADLDVPVLVRGETGVGKERVAQAIHAASGRAGRCVAVNVATLSPSLAASELFGHAKGAFTGASERRAGLFERADGGTLFLDEVGELADDVQPMLLRVLETGTLTPLGARDERPVDVRVVSATDADLEGAVARGRFRAALYHRLRGFEIEVPPLRARREDIPRLASMFLCEELQKTGELARLSRPERDAPPWIDRALMVRLMEQNWPGNVRQLRGIVRQIVVSSRGEPTLRADAAVLRALGDRPAEIEQSESAPDIPRARILEALRTHGWSFGKAARALGVTRAALYRRAQDDPEIRTGNDLDQGELERALREHDGDLDAVAERLQVSKRALKLRLRALGLD